LLWDSPEQNTRRSRRKLAEVERLRLSAVKLAATPVTSGAIEAELKGLDAA
jgi:hypothetical protein